MVSIVTYDDILDVIQEEATEDMYRLANQDTAKAIVSKTWYSI